MAVVPKVVVVGAGFGGIEVARHLADRPVDLTLVDRNNFHTFQPLLYQVATAGLNAADVAHVVRGLFHGQRNLRFRQATVTGVDWADHQVLLARTSRRCPSTTSCWPAAPPSPTSARRAPPSTASPSTRCPDAVRLRNHVVERFESAAARAAAGEPPEDGALTFVVVGGGPTGVETAGALAELFALVFRKDYPELDVSRARIVLVELQDHLLAPVLAAQPPPRARHARAAAASTSSSAPGWPRSAPTAVTLADGEVLPCRTLVWAAGVRANPLADVLGLEQGRGGRIVVGPDLRVPGRDDVWAIGDIAAATDARGEVLPQLAPVAMQAGRHVARQIGRLAEGKPTEPSATATRGRWPPSAAGPRSPSCPVGIHLKGGPAWLAWLGLHLVFLVGKRNRASVLLNWAWNYLTWDRGPRLLLRPDVEPPT